MFTSKRDINTSKETLSGQIKELYSIQVPAAAKCKILKFGNYLNDYSAFGSVVWTIKKNGIPVHPYDVIIDQLGIESLPREIEIDEFDGGDLITFEAQNNYVDTVGIGLALVYELRG